MKPAWILNPPLQSPQVKYIPIGAIPVFHNEYGHLIGYVLPQPGSGETQQRALEIASVPQLIHIGRQLAGHYPNADPDALWSLLIDLRAVLANLNTTPIHP